MNEDLCNCPSLAENAFTLKVGMEDLSSTSAVNNSPLGYRGFWLKRMDSSSPLYTETRIDRYGKSASVKRCFPDIQSNQDLLEPVEGKTHGSSAFMVEGSDFSARCLRSKSPLDLPISSLSPQQTSDCHVPAYDSTGRLSCQKRPRLGWGQGLAQYEKKVVGTEGFVTTLKVDFSGSGTVKGGFLNSSPLEDASVLPDSSPNTPTTNLSAESFFHNYHMENVSSLLVSPLCMPEDCGTVYATLRKDTSLPRDCSSVSISPSDTSCSKGEILQRLENIEHEIDSLEKELRKLDHDEHYFEGSCIKRDPLDMQSEFVVTDADVNLIPEALNENQDVLNDYASDLDASGKMLNIHTLPEDIAKCSNQIVLEENKEFCGEKNSYEIQEMEQSGPCLGVQQQVSDKCLDPIVVSEKPAESHQFVVADLLKANMEHAKEASEELSYLLLRNFYFGKCEVLYHKPSDNPSWKKNIESYEMLKSSVVERISSQEQDRLFKERLLVLKYRYFRESWKKELLFMRQRRDRHKRLKSLRSEDLKILKEVINGGLQQNFQEISLKMPAMRIDEKLPWRFSNKNGLVVDPIATEKERLRVNPWTLEEKHIFYEKFILFNKDFRSIASFLSHKSVADCVQFYYQHQKSDEFKKIKQARMMQNNSDLKNSYLAGKMLKADRYYDLNSSCTIKQLSNMAPARKDLSGYAELISKNKFETLKRFGNHLSNNIDHSKVASVEAISSCQSSVTAFELWDQVHCKEGYMCPFLQSCILGPPVETDGSKATTVQHGSAKQRQQLNSQWTDGEKHLFVAAISIYGKDFKNISQHVGSKTEGQCKAFFSKTRKRLQLDNLLEKLQLHYSGTTMPGAENLHMASIVEDLALQANYGLDAEANRKLDALGISGDSCRRIDNSEVVDTSTMEKVHLSKTVSLSKKSGMKVNDALQTSKTERLDCECSISQEPGIEIKKVVLKQEAGPSGITIETDSKVEEGIQVNSNGTDHGSGECGHLPFILNGNMQFDTSHGAEDASKTDWKVFVDACAGLNLSPNSMEIIGEFQRDDISKSDPNSLPQGKANETVAYNSLEVKRCSSAFSDLVGSGKINKSEVKIENGHSTVFHGLVGSGGSDFGFLDVDQSDATDLIEVSKIHHRPVSSMYSLNVAHSQASEFVSSPHVKTEVYDSAEGNPSKFDVVVSEAKQKRVNKKRDSINRSDNAKRRMHPATSELSSSQHPLPSCYSSLPHLTSRHVRSNLRSQQQDMFIQQNIHQQQLQTAIPLISYASAAILQSDNRAELMARNMLVEDQVMHFQNHQQQQRLILQKHNQYGQNVHYLQDHGIHGPRYLQRIAEISGYQQRMQQRILDQSGLLNGKGQDVQQTNHFQDVLTDEMSQKEQRAAKQEELAVQQPTQQEYLFQGTDAHVGYVNQNKQDFLASLQNQQHENLLGNDGHCHDTQSSFDQVGRYLNPTFGDCSQTGHQQISQGANLGFGYVDDASRQQTGTADIKLFGRSLLSSPSGVMKDSRGSISSRHSLLSNNQGLYLSKYIDQQQEARSDEASVATPVDHLSENFKTVDCMDFRENRSECCTSKHRELLLGAQNRGNNDAHSRPVYESYCDAVSSGDFTLAQCRESIHHNGKAKHEYVCALRDISLWPSSTSNACDLDVLATNSYGSEHVLLQKQLYSGRL